MRSLMTIVSMATLFGVLEMPSAFAGWVNWKTQPIDLEINLNLGPSEIDPVTGLNDDLKLNNVGAELACQWETLSDAPDPVEHGEITTTFETIGPQKIRIHLSGGEINKFYHCCPVRGATGVGRAEAVVGVA